MRTLLSFDRSGSPRRRSFDEPMISVVVPAYNHENFIVQCLTSVVDQTYDAIEIVVVDDCSTDMTFEMARDFLERHKPRFRKISLMRNAANSGAHVSLNRGIAACSGDFLSLMNSDDEYTPDRLTTIVLKMRDENAAFAFSGVATIGPDGAPYWDDPLCHHIAYRPKVALMRYPSLSGACCGASSRPPPATSWSHANSHERSARSALYVTATIGILSCGAPFSQSRYSWTKRCTNIQYTAPIRSAPLRAMRNRRRNLSSKATFPESRQRGPQIGWRPPRKIGRQCFRCSRNRSAWRHTSGLFMSPISVIIEQSKRRRFTDSCPDAICSERTKDMISF